MSGNINSKINTPDQYQQAKTIDSYIAGRKVKRPLAFSQHFGDEGTTFGDIVSVDIEANEQNLMGQYVDPDATIHRVQLPGIGNMDLSFAYSKEYVGSPNYEEIAQRSLMQNPGSFTLDKATLARNYASNMREQMSLAYKRVENLHELSRANILLYGKHSTSGLTSGGKHRQVNWDLGRTVLTNPGTNNQTARDAAYATVMGVDAELVPEVDLTTLWANTTTAVPGGLSWDSYNPTAAATIATADIVNTVDPVIHLNRMLTIANERAGTEAIYMANDAFSWFIETLNVKYADGASRFVNTNENFVLQLMPKVQEQEGLTLKLVWNGPQGPIPIYIYNGTYIDRESGVKKKYFPNGYVLLVPPAQYGSVRYGKIKNLKAMFNAQKFWVNTWVDERSGAENWELHTNFVVYHTDINSAVSWKVCSTAHANIYY